MPAPRPLRLGFAIDKDNCIEVFNEIAEPADANALFLPPKPSPARRSWLLHLPHREMLMWCLFVFTNMQKIDIARMFNCGIIDVSRAVKLIYSRLTDNPVMMCRKTKRIIEDIEFAIKLRFQSLTPAEPEVQQQAKPKPEYVDYGFPVNIKTLRPMVLEVLQQDPHRHWFAKDILNHLANQYNIVGTFERKRWSMLIGPCLQTLVRQKVVKRRYEKTGSLYKYSYQYQLK